MQKWITTRPASALLSPASSSAQSGVDGNHGSQTQINNISKSKGGLGIPSASTPDIRYATNNNSTTIPVSRTNGTVLQNSSVSLLPGDSVGSLAEVDLLRNEVHTLKKELVRCRETITKMQEREKVLRDRLSEQAQKQLERGSKFEDLSLGENRPSQLVRRYGNLYSQTRLDAFDALDELPEMAEFDDLKGKLLFSVIVLAFRSAQQNQRQLRHKIRQMLCLPETKNPTDTDPMTTMGKELDDMITIYLRKTVEKFDISASSEEVCNQVWATLYDYPSLKNCAALKSYIEECVRIAWSLVSQNPPLIVDYDCRQFDVDYHTRFHTSDPDAKQIRSVLWPALLEGENGPCVQKGVVIT